MTVSYLVIIGNGVATEAINDYFGYGEDASALHDKAHEAYTGNKNIVLPAESALSFKLTRPVTIKQ